MADVNANIGVGIETSDALNQLKNLQRQISQFHQSVAKSSATAAASQRDLQKNFLNSVNAIQGFSAELRTVKTTAESFSSSLEKNKFSIKQYFNYAVAASGKFSKSFRAEFDTIEKTAIERVKTLQTQYVKLGRDANGAMQSIAIRPTTLDMGNLGTQTAISAQKMVLFNQIVKQGSTQLLNFGKNTQWAGRQLMVGFTLPLATLGMTAGRTFMEMEKAVLKFRKVYGDLFSTQEDTQKALDSIVELGKAYTQYGVAVADTVSTASDAAAAGFQGVDLQNQTAAALKLSVLGQIDQAQALETTIALQNALNLSSGDLAGTIDFLNAVENQTVVSLDDITTAIPKVAPVIQQLGGDVKDLAFFMAAMKEGGINASEGANALKSGLASLINPTSKASDMLMSFGINIQKLVQENKGDLRGTVVQFAQALDQLDPLNRAKAIEQMFGKFQFARLSALFANVAKDGTQASRVLDLAGSSLQELSALSEKEMGQTAASSMNKFYKAIEDIKVALVPLGQMFIEIATPFVEFGTKMLDAFNSLPDGIKKGVGTIVGIIGGLGPVLLMTFGLINNGIANMIKFFATVSTGYLKLTGKAQGIGQETQYMTEEQMVAAAAAASLDQAHSNLTQRFTAEASAVNLLKTAYEQAVAAGNRFALMNPGQMRPGMKPPGFASGGFIKGPGSGKSDSIGAMVSNGEAIIPADKAKKYAPLVQGIIAGSIPGFANGKAGETIGTVLGGTFQKKTYSPAAMMAPGNTTTGPGMDLSWLQNNDQAKASWAASLKTIMMIESGLKVTQSEYSKFGQDLGPTLDNLLEVFKQGITESTTSISKVGETQYPLMIQHIESLEESGKLAAEEALKLKDAIRKLVKPLESDKTQQNLQRVELALNEAGDAYVKRASTERTGSTYKPQTKRAFAQEMKMRGISSEGTQDFTFAHIPDSPATQGYTDPSLRKKAGAGSGLEQQVMSRLSAGEILKEGDVVIKKVADAMLERGAATVRAGGEAYVEGAKREAQINSPSRVTGEIGEQTVAGQVNALKAGVDDVKVASTELAAAQTIPLTQATKRAKTAFGNPQPEPAPALNSTSFIGPLQKGLGDKMVGLSDKISKVTFGLSAVTGVLSVFGADLGGFTNIIMGVSSAMFALVQMTGLLAKTKMAEVVATRAATVAKGMGAAEDVAGAVAGGGKGVMNMIGGIFKSGSGIFSKLFTGLGFVAKFLGPVGIGLSALSIVLPFIIKLYNDQKDKMEAFGKIVAVTADQIKYLGDKAGESVTTTSGFQTTTLSTQGEVNTADAKAKADDEEFRAKFEAQINAAKAGAVSTVEDALNLLAYQLSSSGLSDAVVSQTIAGIMKASGRTDLKFDFASVGISDKNTAGLVSDLKTKIQAVKPTNGTSPNTVQSVGRGGGYNPNGQAALDSTKIAEIGTSAGALMKGLSTQLAAGAIDLKEYTDQFDTLRSTLNGLSGDAQQAAIGKAISDIFPEDKAMQDSVKGVKDLDKQMQLLELAGIGGSKSMDKFLKMSKDGKTSKTAFTAAIQKEISAQKTLNDTNKAAEIIATGNAEADAIRDKIQVYEDLVKGGTDAAIAYKIAGDAALTEGYKTAIAAGNLKEWLDGVKEIEALSKKFEGFNPTGGGGKKEDPIGDAIKNLKAQRTEILNTSASYTKLTKAGYSAQDALKFAQNPDLLSAMNAGVKVGSKKWTEIISKIKAAESALVAFNQKTVQGKQDQFNGVFDKVSAIFDAQEAVYNAAFDKKTETDNKLIEELEKQIDDYNDSISALDHQLEGVAEQEAAINKAYDEKNKALQQSKKLNQDILNQQKSQLSIADALSSGDISAAASAMQQARAENANAAAESQGGMLDAARQAQLDAVTAANGQTRKQIEEAIKSTKDKIYAIETGTLKAAQDRVLAEEKALKAQVEGLTVGGKTKVEWDGVKNNLELSAAKAALLKKEVKLALDNAVALTKEYAKPVKKQITVEIREVKVASVAKASGGKIGYYANGLTEWGKPRGTDTVPAMLTPGEFVINRKASQKFGPLLQSINSGRLGKTYSTDVMGSAPEMVHAYKTHVIGNAPEMVHAYQTAVQDYAPKTFNQELPAISNSYKKFPGNSSISVAESNTQNPAPAENSVYNYNLSVNVEGSDASADQIASVVMSKLRNMKSQKVRGQVIR